MTNYGKICYYRIQDVIYQSLDDVKLTTDDGEEMTICQYYLKKYNITITNKKQPLLLAENKNKNSVISIKNLENRDQVDS